MIYSALSCLLGKQKPGLFKKSIRPVFIAEKNDAALIAVRRRIQPALFSCAWESKSPVFSKNPSAQSLSQKKMMQL